MEIKIKKGSPPDKLLDLSVGDLFQFLPSAQVSGEEVFMVIPRVAVPDRDWAENRKVFPAISERERQYVSLTRGTIHYSTNTSVRKVRNAKLTGNL